MCRWSSARAAAAADALHTCPKDPASRDFLRLVRVQTRWLPRLPRTVLRIAACMTVFSP